MEDASQTAREIWDAAVHAVRSEYLVRKSIRVASDSLIIGDQHISLDSFDRLIVVGAGKASAGMARGLIEATDPLAGRGIEVVGWINVPDDCVESINPLRVFAARPAGLNEPTPEALYGTTEILRLLESATKRDLAICLISGGGSALLVAPHERVSLADKILVTKFLSDCGANIQQLNTVRKQLSKVKGNGLAQTFRGGRILSLIISDVIGDSLEVIASGPTTPNSTGPQDALQILTQFDPQRRSVPPSVYQVLDRASAETANETTAPAVSPNAEATNLIIGNLKVATDAAFEFAKRAGLNAHSSVATEMESHAEEIGFQMTDRMIEHAGTKIPFSKSDTCFVEGGEPTVQLIDSSLRGKGGRNQQLVLAALLRIMQSESPVDSLPPFCILSGGTDGEDGPTNAAGAFIDNATIPRAVELGLDPADYLRRNDAWNFFRQTGNLIVTGPTHTNVGDIRVTIV